MENKKELFRWKFKGDLFHQLEGKRKGAYSVKVTGNWRITFKFRGENAIDVDYED